VAEVEEQDFHFILSLLNLSGTWFAFGFEEISPLHPGSPNPLFMGGSLGLPVFLAPRERRALV
jgi:hypothetical protein